MIKNSANKESQSLKGIGLKNIKKRLAALYPNTHSLQITQTNNVFKVNLRIKTNTIKR